MKKLESLKKAYRVFQINFMKMLGFVPIEHIVYGAYFVPSGDGLYMTLKHIVQTKVEFFWRGTPREEIDRYNKAFARQQISANDLYSYRTQWSWRIVE